MGPEYIVSCTAGCQVCSLHPRTFGTTFDFTIYSSERQIFCPFETGCRTIVFFNMRFSGDFLKNGKGFRPQIYGVKAGKNVQRKTMENNVLFDFGFSSPKNYAYKKYMEKHDARLVPLKDATGFLQNGSFSNDPRTSPVFQR